MKTDELKKIGTAVREIADAVEIVYANALAIADVFDGITKECVFP